LIDVINDNPLVLLIPLISAIVGWGTNLIAVKMMFHPLEFIGIKPIKLGWQGIVPANAVSLARVSTEIITTKLINLKMLFESFDAKSFASGNMNSALDEMTDQIIAETAAKYAPEMWANMPDAAKQQVRTLMRTEVEQVAVKILADVGDNIEDIIDLKAIVIEAATKDKKLIGDMFQTVGVEEFKFIKISGLYFGFLFGIVQFFAWMAYPAFWVLPLFGFMVGYLTNWLALKLIFEPQEPKKIGPFTVHGLFHKRQAAVAKEFATMVSKQILNTENMVQKMITGEAGDKLFGIVEKHMNEMLVRYQENPFTKSLVPEGEWDNIRTEVSARIREELPKEGGFLYVFVGQAIDVFGELFDRMTELDSESFESTLRPAFQKDEWKLILAGAVLGLAAGVGQVLFMFKDQLS